MSFENGTRLRQGAVPVRLDPGTNVISAAIRSHREGSVRIAVIVVGLVVMLVGIAGAAYGFLTAGSVETSYTLFCPGGQMPPDFCSALLATAASYRTLAYVMSGVFVLGLGIALAGAFLYEPVPMPVLAPPGIGPPNPWRMCARCGSSVPSADRFRMRCGAPQW